MRACAINTGKFQKVACQGCQTIFPISEFPQRSDRSGRYRPYCRSCARTAQKARYAAHKRLQPFKLKATRSKSRSQFLKAPYDLTAQYLETIWTGRCPVFGVAIHLTGDRRDEFAAELDRLAPEKGYVVGNVAFLSRRANRLKNDTTTHELKQLLTWMESHDQNC